MKHERNFTGADIDYEEPESWTLEEIHELVAQRDALLDACEAYVVWVEETSVGQNANEFMETGHELIADIHAAIARAKA